MSAAESKKFKTFILRSIARECVFGVPARKSQFADGEKMRERTFKARRDKLLKEEAQEPEAWWWLSFCDPDLPEGSQFLGGIFTKARGFVSAIQKTHDLGINPGGEVKGAGPIPDEVANASPEGRKHVELADRLLSRKDIDDNFGGARKMP
jgi:hypothetical protein